MRAHLASCVRVLARSLPVSSCTRVLLVSLVYLVELLTTALVGPGWSNVEDTL